MHRRRMSRFMSTAWRGFSTCSGRLRPSPLDPTADARRLDCGDGAAGDDGVEGGAEVVAGDGLAVRGAAVVELAAVDEFAVRAEEVEVRGAGGRVGAGDRLSL